MKRLPWAKLYLLPILGTVVLMLLGLALLIWPAGVINMFSPLLGIVLIVVGAQVTAHSLVMGRRVAAPGAALVRGLIMLLVGVVFITKRDLSLAFLSVLFGLYILVSAALDFSSALESRYHKRPYGLEMAGSIFSLAIGLLLLFSPFSGLDLWARVLGGYFLLMAGNTLFTTVRMVRKDIAEFDAKQQKEKEQAENEPLEEDGQS